VCSHAISVCPSVSVATNGLCLSMCFLLLGMWRSSSKSASVEGRFQLIDSRGCVRARGFRWKILMYIIFLFIFNASVEDVSSFAVIDLDRKRNAGTNAYLRFSETSFGSAGALFVAELRGLQSCVASLTLRRSSKLVKKLFEI